MADEHWLWQLNRSIASDTALGKQLLDEMLSALRAHGWPAHDLFGIHLSAHEALVNAILHGNRLSPGKTVEVICRLSADRVVIEIADEGEGFDPARLPDCTEPDRVEIPCGRGVMLMRAFMSRVEYSSQGNRVVLEKRRENMAVD